MKKMPVILTFDIDGETLTVDCLMCAVCNGRTYGGGFRAAPEAQPDENELPQATGDSIAAEFERYLRRRGQDG